MENKENPSAQRLVKAFTQFRRYKRKRPPILDLNHSEFALLHKLKHAVKPDSPGIKVSELSALMDVTTPTVTQWVNGLEKKGYVVRNADKEDRRVVRIKLSLKGENILKKAFDDFFATFNGLVEYLGEEKSNQLADLLEQVANYFNQVNENEK